jgi:hypothetical protein
MWSGPKTNVKFNRSTGAARMFTERDVKILKQIKIKHAWGKNSFHMGTDSVSVEKKIKSLLAQYRTESNKSSYLEVVPTT